MYGGIDPTSQIHNSPKRAEPFRPTTFHSGCEGSLRMSSFQDVRRVAHAFPYSFAIAPRFRCAG